MNIDNIKKINNLMKEKEELENKLAQTKDDIAEIRSKCHHIPVKVANLQINNVAYCLFCGKRVTRQRDYFIDAHTFKYAEYGDGFTEKDRANRLKDLQNEALKLYNVKGNLDNEEMVKELKEIIKASNNKSNEDEVLKKVLGKWIGIWMSKDRK